MVGLAVMATLFTGCGSALPASVSMNDTGTQMAANYETMPTLPAGVTAKTIQINPSSMTVHLGETKAIAVVLGLSNGQTATDPRLVRWSVADPQSGSIDIMGQFTPKAPRMTSIRAEIGDIHAEIPVTIASAEYNWQQVATPTHNDLYGVKMVSGKEAWAVGDKGTLLHLVNNYWQLDSAPVANATLKSVDFIDPGTGWAVGNDGSSAVVLSYRSGSWFPMNTGVSGALNSVDAVDFNNAWAGGKDSSGKVLLMKWNGRSWLRDTSYSGKGQINSISMVGSIGWAVGTDGHDALILHCENGKWTEDRLPFLFTAFQSSELRAVKMINANQGYAVGVRDNLVGFPKGLVLKFDSRGSQTFRWSNWTSSNAAGTQTPYLDQVPLNNVALLSGDQGWFLGATITPKVVLPKSSLNDIYGNLLSWDGTNYQIDSKYRKVNLSKEFLGVDLTPQGDGIIVGRNGYIMQRQYDWYGSDSNQGYSGPATSEN